MNKNNQKIEVGLITYHSAYNFGSVLQATATQEAIKKITGCCEIINYRMKEQKKFYARLRFKYGIKILYKDILLLPIWKKRGVRKKKFESYINSYMNLTDEITEPKDVDKIWYKYDVIVSGSDQIWNKNSCELKDNSWQYMNPYLLKGFHGKKCSYASSIGQMSDEEIDNILNEIEQFSSISMREKISADRLQSKLNQSIKTVLDPTFLLTKEEWINLLHLNSVNSEEYILYYSLNGIRDISTMIPILKQYGEKNKKQIKVIAPFVYIKKLPANVIQLSETGPIEFMNLLNNATEIITDSYHGTILSINLKKNFYSICKKGGAEFRKTDILERVNLLDRVIYEPAMLLEKEKMNIDYENLTEKLEQMRIDSFNYLENALNCE